MSATTPLVTTVLSDTLHIVSDVAKVGLAIAAGVAVGAVTIMAVKEISSSTTFSILGVALFLSAFTHDITYKGRHGMPMTMSRAKARAQREIDVVYDEAWFHNIVEDTRKKVIDATDLANHVVPANWNWL